MREYDIWTDRLVCRFDVLSGIAPIQREYNAWINAQAESWELEPRTARPAGWTYRAPHEPLRFHPDAFTLECEPAEWEPLVRAA